MKKCWVHIRAILACLLILTSCTEIDQPLNGIDNVVKIETKWQCDDAGNRHLKIYNKEFDKSGRLVKVTEFDSNGGAKLVRKIRYIESGSTETAEYYNANGEVDSTKYVNTQADSFGNAIRKVETNATGDTLAICKYLYDGQGNLINSVVVSADGKSATATDYFYNQRGSLTTSIQKDAMTGVIQKTDSVVYNANSSIDKIMLDESGNLKLINTFFYDASGRIMKECAADASGKIIKTFIYDYIYY